MKTRFVLLGATLLGGMLPVATFANVIVPFDSAPPRFEAPLPERVVKPTGLMRRHEGAVVKLSLTIDQAGRPHDIRIVSPQDRNLAERLLPAGAQWRFKPATKNGAPVATKILLPVQLVDGPVS
jgi:TonB family protein